MSDQIADETKPEKELEVTSDEHAFIKPIVVSDILPCSTILCPNVEDLPLSYRSNSRKEELILTYIEHCRRQYHFIYPNRKPLLLSPLNECGVTKFVCTTIRPTMLPYSDLTEWKSTADFIADHLNYDLLEPVHRLPSVLASPTQILADQHGNTFDYAHLLCSLLIGAGYDAYVVSGYATRDICYMDTTRLLNPYTREREEERVEQMNSQCQKYGMRPAKDLTSKYDAYIHRRYFKKIEREKGQMEKEEHKRIAEIERPISDPLHGIRVHAWTLILPGKRDITEAFYIEPTTGYAKATNDSEYLGIESIWNNANLWINMQDCSKGCESLQFDLTDQSRWECLFPSSFSLSPDHQDEDEKTDRTGMKLSNQMTWFDKTKFYFTNPIRLPLSNINAISYYHQYPEQIRSEIFKRYYTSDTVSNSSDIHTIDLPLSWVAPLEISAKKFQKRYPNATKKSFFKKTFLEKYAPYHKKDGLVLKVSEFADYHFKEYLHLTFFYEHRHDKLDIREHDLQTNTINEKYRPGRTDHLKEYIYGFGAGHEQTMVYYHKSRFDGLSQRYEMPDQLTDSFLDREDFLQQRATIFEPTVHKSSSTPKHAQRTMISITEKYNRNLQVHANVDIQELVYAIRDNEFRMIYHRHNDHILPSTRTYIKPSNWNDKAFRLKWTDDLHRTYQADEDFKQPSKRDLYHQMLQLIERETDVIKRVRKAEEETRDLLSRRHHEELASDLEVSVYDMDRNEKSKLYRTIFQQMDTQKKSNKDPDEVDYLAPYLAAIGNPQQINATKAEQLRFIVERDFQIRSVRIANHLQIQYDNGLNQLLDDQHQSHPSKEEQLRCERGKFRLDVLEERLKQHQDLSKSKYLELQSKMNADGRLREPYALFDDDLLS